MADGGSSILGTTVHRVEDQQLLTGRATFVDGLAEHDSLHGAFVRSPHAHARIVRVDVAEACRAPGVIAVLTAADLRGWPVPPGRTANRNVVRHPLAVDTVRYVGEPVALVVADGRARAADAVELVDVDYDPLPAVVDPEAALAPDAPQLLDALPGNVAATRAAEDRTAPWPAGARVVRLRMENQRIASAPMEGHAILARPQPDGGLVVYLGTQDPHRSRDAIATFTGLDPAKVRVVAPHVGGGFGGKLGAAPEHLAVVAAARILSRAVKWAETRSETMLSMQGRGQVQYAELAVDDDGRFLGLRVRIVGDGGAYAGYGGKFATGHTHTMAQGVYAIPELRYAAVSAVTNTAPTGAFRGAGRPEATALVERVVDCAAHALGLPPEEIRRRNFIPADAFPYETRTGATYDVGDYDRPLREALRIVDVDAVRAEQRARRASGAVRLLGVGISTYVEVTGFGGPEHGIVEVHADGTVTVGCGTAAQGQGHATAFAMVVADQLGIPVERITLAPTDTGSVPTGGGTLGSRSLQTGGSAVHGAAAKVRERAKVVASRLLDVPPGDVVLSAGVFCVRGVPGATVSWQQVAAHAHAVDGGLRGAEDFEQPGHTFPFGAHVSVVEVDTETGRVTPLRHVAVDDCGTVANPLLVRGQQHGGALQGMSQALWEHFRYDELGNPLTSTLMDYTLPTAVDAVDVEAANTETPTPLNPLGAKGVGESATIGSTPAVLNAVVDALSHLGVRHIDPPCTPMRVWSTIERARTGRLPEPWREPPPVFDEIVRRSPAEDVPALTRASGGTG